MTLSTSTKSTALHAIDEHASELIALSQSVLNEAESGFREFKTAEKVAAWMSANGLEPRTGIAITGVVARVDSGKRGPNVAVMGELDGLIIPGHKHASPETSAAHACGHHVQLGNMLGVAAAVLADGVLEQLSGSVTFMAVPAEEYVELEYREGLRVQGKIEFLGGKQEFIRLGEFDNVDLAMMTHTTAEQGSGVIVSGAHNGMLAKRVAFRGTASHAGASPFTGVNALNAANIGLAAIHAQRETFRDTDYVRVHPIITRGGDSVNSVPADVRVETFVRAASVDAMLDAAGKVDRALRAGALAVGGSVEISTSFGYMPSTYDPVLIGLYRKNAEEVFGSENLRTAGQRGSSSDAGDVSQLMPVIHPWVDCASGRGHGVDYIVDDYRAGVVKAAKAMAGTVIDLLSDGAAEGKKVVESFSPAMTVPEYLAQLRELRTNRSYTG